MPYYLDELSDFKLQYFTGNKADGLEPKCDIFNVPDGTADEIASTICYGPGPGL